MKALKTMQKSLKWMLFLLVCVVIAAAVLGGLFIKNKLDERAARQAEYEQALEEKADEITLTFLPGNSIFTARRMLLNRGFSEEEVEAAFSKQYGAMTRLGRPTSLTGVTASQVEGAAAMLGAGNVSIEGFLFPETINFFATASVETIVGRMASELERAVEREGLVAKFGAQRLTFYEGLILASIVEAEIGGTHEDARAIAAIFYNRLRAGWTLGADATTLYAANMAGLPINNADGTPNRAILGLDSPWNTRHAARTGLPPTPIGSPSLPALIATADPDLANYQGYFYFLTGDSGATYFGRTEAEHQNNIREYCQTRCARW
ncbi:endolytic transglycosylase MltG [Candidatus Saccharibacteria bacterium]|nr:endolytic transglycosylase MltG [Candidatus Saccharibacteria bacterium]